jgi:hypothetical protein
MPPGIYHLRCSAGHVYTTSLQAIRWRSLQIGTTQYRRCPAGRKWRRAVFVNPGTLTGSDLEQEAARRV